MPMKMLVVTNRRLENATTTNASLFGEHPHVNGPGEIRLAWAEKKGNKWLLSLISEPAKGGGQVSV